MSQPGINLSLASGGLGRQPDSLDHVSGMLFFTNRTLPAGFAANDRIKQVFSTAQAEALGIVDTKADETRATGTVQVTNAGTAGNAITATVNEGAGAVVLGAYTSLSGDDVNDIAAGLAAAINQGTPVHGYSASVSTDTVTVTAKVGAGADANDWTLAAAVTGTLTATVVSFASGVNAELDVFHYHIDTYFKRNPTGRLYVMLAAVPSSYNFEELRTMQRFAEGAIRLFGVFNHQTAFSSAHVSSINSRLDEMLVDKSPAIAILTPDVSGTATLTDLPNLSTLTAPRVTVDIAQDGGNVGKVLFDQKGYSIGSLGSALGTLSAIDVASNIGRVLDLDQQDGEEFATIAFSNGDLWRDKATGFTDVLYNFRYLFMKREPGKSGAYYVDDRSSAPTTNDFSNISLQRTADKVLRLAFEGTLNNLKSKVKLNPNGTINEVSRQKFITDIDGLIRGSMVNIPDPTLSEVVVEMDPAQKPVQAGSYQIGIKMVPVDTARVINIVASYTLSI